MIPECAAHAVPAGGKPRASGDDPTAAQTAVASVG